jgi:hypothetical protein
LVARVAPPEKLPFLGGKIPRNTVALRDNAPRRTPPSTPQADLRPIRAWKPSFRNEVDLSHEIRFSPRNRFGVAIVAAAVPA